MVPIRTRGRQLWRKLLARSDFNRSRLHDERGRCIAFERLCRNGPRALRDTLLYRVFGVRGIRPWLSYDAQRRIAAHLTPQSRVLEFGSGLSTLWLSRRCGFLLSVEHEPTWYQDINARLSSVHHADVRYELRPSYQDYPRLSPAEAGDGFDLILVDGLWRDRCVESARSHLRPGGIIYLDNADRTRRENGHPTGDTPRARALLVEFAQRENCILESYIDFVTGTLLAQEGLLVQRPLH